MFERCPASFEASDQGLSVDVSGVDELNPASTFDRLGLVINRIVTLAYQCSFDMATHRGEVPVSVSLFPRNRFNLAADNMREIFSEGFGIGDLFATASEGENLGNIIVPPGMIGMATLSHFAICGAWLRAGIPVDIKFGGLLQIRNRRALRFVELIDYAGCSLDPAEVFVASRMTSVGSTAAEGAGKILASFCDIPAVARKKAEQVLEALEAADMKSLVILGKTGETVCQLPVPPNRIGVILADGLNPVAATVEAGIKVENHTLSGTIDYDKLERFCTRLSVGR
jgi:repressor of nif and glnA expression